MLCSNPEAIQAAYGPYVVPVLGNVKDVSAVAASLTGVKRIVCTREIGDVPLIARKKGVESIALISSTGELMV